MRRFFPQAVPSGGTPIEEGPESCNDVPPREIAGGGGYSRPSEPGSSPVEILTVPEPIEHSDVGRAAATPSTGQWMEHSEDSGDWQNGRQSHTDDSI